MHRLLMLIVILLLLLLPGCGSWKIITVDLSPDIEDGGCLIQYITVWDSALSTDSEQSATTDTPVSVVPNL